MDDWDSPKRSRLFLAAALLTAACGFMLTNDRLDSPRLVENGLSAQLAAPDEAAASDAGFVARQEPLSEEAPGPVPEALAARPVEDLRDAVAASPAMDAAQTATRTAAFAGPAGRVPGAFAPAAAASAWAARRALRPTADGPSAAAISISSAPAEPARRRREVSAVAPRASGGFAPRGSAKAGRGRTLSPAERLFAAPELGFGELSSGGAEPAKRGAAPAERRRERKPRIRRAPGLSRLLGKGALKAPRGLKAPARNPWARPIPASGPDGAALSAKPLGVAASDAVAHPPVCRKKGVHWDSRDGVQWYHDGALRGRLDGGRWAWMEEDQGRWWLWPAPKSAPLVDSQDHWWLKSRGLWFLLQDGQAWGYQYLRRWGTEGFVARSGAQMIYSADGSRLGMIVPGEGAVLYDARTGQELGRWSDDQLPRRRGAAAPPPPSF